MKQQLTELLDLLKTLRLALSIASHNTTKFSTGVGLLSFASDLKIRNKN